METSTKWAIGISIGVVLIGGTLLVVNYRFNKGKSKTLAEQKKQKTVSIPTEKQFDTLVELANKKGSDWFQGVSATQLKDSRNKFINNLSSEDANHITYLTDIGEKNWTASQKIQFSDILFKWTGKRI